MSLFGLVMQQTNTIWTINKEGHMRIISAKFGKNLANCLDVFKATVYKERWKFNNHNSSPIGSGELNKRVNEILNRSHEISHVDFSNI